MPTRPCLSCNRLTTRGTRCELCQRLREQSRGNSAQRGYDASWRRLVAQAKAAQRRTHGVVWCVDCGITEEQAKASGSVISGDHLRWPAVTVDDCEVVCRECNSRRGARRSAR